MTNKKLLALEILEIWSGIVTESLDIVLNEYPEIVVRAIIQVMEKNPEIIKKLKERKG